MGPGPVERPRLGTCAGVMSMPTSRSSAGAAVRCAHQHTMTAGQSRQKPSCIRGNTPLMVSASSLSRASVREVCSEALLPQAVQAR